MGDEKKRIVLIVRDWRERTLIRAQLMEEGYEVDGYERPEDLPEGITPSLIIFDTHGQSFSEETFRWLKEGYGDVPCVVIAEITDRPLPYIRRYAIPLFRPISIEELCKKVKDIL